MVKWKVGTTREINPLIPKIDKVLSSYNITSEFKSQE